MLNPFHKKNLIIPKYKLYSFKSLLQIINHVRLISKVVEFHQLVEDY